MNCLCQGMFAERDWATHQVIEEPGFNCMACALIWWRGMKNEFYSTFLGFLVEIKELKNENHLIFTYTSVPQNYETKED